MSKYLKTAAAALALVALAVPAMAEQKVSGYFRTQFMADNIGSNFAGMASGDKRTASQIDNRFRLMYTNNLNEYVSFVYFGEVDTAWGQSGKAAAGQGGTDGADGVNVETKNVYVDFKIPDSIISTRVGIQGVGVGPHGILLGDDMAAARVNLKLTPMADVTAIYSKWRENTTTMWDDVDFYAAVLSLKPSDAVKLNFDLAWLDANTLGQFGAAAGIDGVAAAAGLTQGDVYALGVGADANLGMAKIDAYLAYTGGTLEGPAPIADVDLSGWMATAKGTVKVGTMGDAGLRLTYYSSDDNAADNDYEGFIGDLSGGVYEFAGENLSIFYADAPYNNTNGGRRALIDAAYNGNGLLGINATSNLNFTKACYGKFGAGYFMALEENGATDKSLGFEVAARVGHKFAEKVDLSLGGAYAFVGDFYKVGTTDPDNVFKTSLMLNVSY